MGRDAVYAADISAEAAAITHFSRKTVVGRGSGRAKEPLDSLHPARIMLRRFRASQEVQSLKLLHGFAFFSISALLVVFAGGCSSEPEATTPDRQEKAVVENPADAVYVGGDIITGPAGAWIATSPAHR